MTTFLDPERLAKIEDRATVTQRELATQSNAAPAAILLANVDVPDLIAEVKRLSGELTKYVGWEPTVKEEYEHACGQLATVSKVVEQFAAGDQLAVNQFVADLKNALELS